MLLADFKNIALCLGLLALAGCAQPTQQADTAPDVPVNTQTLVGATPAVLNADFGTPVLRRTDGSAQVWLYQSAVCGLDVFLYPDANGAPHVAAVLPDSTDASGCLQSFSRGTTAASLQVPLRS